MAGKNQRSSTLPPNLRHGVQQTEESEGFFSRLKKRFKLKKGRYHVDVSTGECQNVAAVSFKKRESRELVDADDESPWHLRDPKLETQKVFVHSPKATKKFESKQTGKQSALLKGQERKMSNPETYTRSLNYSEVSSLQRKSFGANPKSTNEYCPLAYNTKENNVERSQAVKEKALKNETIVLHDDSAIEVDTDVEQAVKVSSESENIFNDDFAIDPGYEKLPVRRHSSHEKKTTKKDIDAKYKSFPNTQGMTDIESEFDPNYESVDEVKSKIAHITQQDCLEFEDDPGYQSVKDVKRQPPENSGEEMIRPAKTYNINKSIESLDEPGYECLNDVKQRIMEQNLDKPNVKGLQENRVISKSMEISKTVANASEISQTCSGDEFNDSAIGSVGCVLLNESPRSSHISGDSGVAATTDSNDGVRAFAETAVCLTELATALSASGSSKDSAIETEQKSDQHHDVDSLENMRDLYSSVKKSSTGGDSENLYSSVNKGRVPASNDKQQDPGEMSHGPGTKEQISDPVVDDYDSDTGIMLDPGYAECADAIKGIIPYSVYSEGSGSKMSSCTSLDLSAEDFAIEPGYAECADAIKSGAIKKISKSHERLFDHTIAKNDSHKTAGEISSEIYANPQILLRKRSKLIEDDNNSNDKNKNNGEINTKSDQSNVEEIEICSIVKKKSKKKENKTKKSKDEKQLSIEAPPLPARNYSLYLENEEAEGVVQEVLQDIEKDGNLDSASLDDAFETEVVKTTADGAAVVKSDTEICSADHEKRLVEKEISQDKLENVSGTSKVESLSEIGNSVVSSDSNTLDETNKSATQNINDETKLPCSESKVSQLNQYSKSCSCETTCTGHQNCRKDPGCCLQTNSDLNESPMSSGMDEVDSGVIDKLENSFNGTRNNCSVGLTDAQSGNDSHSWHVNVKDEKGQVKTLTIVEKEESIYLQKRREKMKKRVTNSSDDQSAFGDCFGVGLSVQTNQTEVTEDTDVTDSQLVNLESDNELSKVDSETVGLMEVTNNDNHPEHCSIGVVSSSEALSTGIVPKLTKTSASDNNENLHINLNTYHSNFSSNLQDFSDTDSNNFLTVAVKMKTISVDSDSDFGNSDDLPKLVINESDLESAFDSSDNSNNLDIESESAGIDKLTKRLNTEYVSDVVADSEISRNSEDVNDNVENITELVNVSDASEQVKTNSKTGAIHSDDHSIKTSDSLVDKDSVVLGNSGPISDIRVFKCSENGPFDENKNSGVVHCGSRDTYHVGIVNEVPVFSEVNDDAIERKSTLESRLCVIESENEGATDLTKIMSNYSERESNVTGAESEDLSDDSAIGNINDLQQVASIVDTGADRDMDHSHSVNIIEKLEETSEVSSFQQPLKYQVQHPYLYEDLEPTHMSLEEAMGLSPTHSSHTGLHSNNTTQITGQNDSRSHNELLDQTAISNSRQELSSITFPPPRPPPVFTSGSRPMLTGSHGNPAGTSVDSEVQMRNKEPGQVDQSAIVTPTDEGPPVVRFSYSAGQAEEPPPAIPPRSKSVRTPRRPDRGSYSQDFMESMRQLKDCGWYWGPLSWEEAELKLAKKPEGTFLVRDSSDEHYILSLSFKNQGRVHHTRIEHHKGHFSFWSQPDSHGKSTIKEFIEQCVENSRNGRFLYFIRPSGPGSPPMPIQLLHPVSRFIQMRSLQHMCRFRILQLVRRDHIDHLPIPTRIKQYLKEAQYYVEYLED